MARLQHVAGDIQQPLHLGADPADRVGDRRVAAPAVELAAGVDADDVSFHQLPRAGNAVDDFFVDRDAGHGRESGTVPGTPLNSGSALCSAKNRSIDRVDLGRGHARPDHRRDKLMRLPDQQPGLAHLGDFSRRP